MEDSPLTQDLCFIVAARMFRFSSQSMSRLEDKNNTNLSSLWDFEADASQTDKQVR